MPPPTTAAYTPPGTSCRTPTRSEQDTVNQTNTPVLTPTVKDTDTRPRVGEHEIYLSRRQPEVGRSELTDAAWPPESPPRPSAMLGPCVGADGGGPSRSSRWRWRCRACGVCPRRSV
jgi:hypothetical protein